MERNWVIVSKAEFRAKKLGLTYTIEKLTIYIVFFLFTNNNAIIIVITRIRRKWENRCSQS